MTVEVTYTGCNIGISVRMVSKYADLILLNGKILSMDSRDGVFQAVAVRAGKIIAVTSDKKVTKLIGKRTRVIDLHSRVVTPGLIDTHSHLATTGTELNSTADISHPLAKSIRDIVSIVEKKISELGEGRWILGRSWDEALLEERRQPTRWDLDSVSPRNPVVLFHASGHSLLVNSLAFRLADISSSALDLSGFITKNERGEPTGLLKESAAALVTASIPPLTTGQIEEGITRAQEDWLREGVTANKEPGLEGDCLPMIEAYRNLDQRRLLKVRTYLLERADTLKNVEHAAKLAKRSSKSVDDMLRIGGVKIFLDGSSRIRTGWMYDDWNLGNEQTDKGNRGRPLIDPDVLRKLVFEAHKRGLQVCIHAVGDHAIDATLDVIEEATRKYPRKDHRHSIIHCIVPTKKALDRIRRLGVVVETQPSFLFFFGDVLSGNLGPDRCRRVMPMKSFLRKGIIAGNGADAPYYPLAPKFGLFAACTRKFMKGSSSETPFGNDECLTVREALKTYTQLAAKCLFWEDKIGTIEKGKYADFAVWPDDLDQIALDKLRDLKAVMTIVGGKVLHEAQNQ